MLMMLSTVVVGAAALVLPLLCAVLVLPTPDDPARPLIDHRPRGGPLTPQRFPDQRRRDGCIYTPSSLEHVVSRPPDRGVAR